MVVLRGSRVEEFDFESANKKPLRGNIYLAKVTRVEPSLQAAFIEYGGNRHGFLAFSEIHPDYYQIPVADRQALLEEEARSHREDEEEAAGERRSRRRQRPRPTNRRCAGDERVEAVFGARCRRESDLAERIAESRRDDSNRRSRSAGRTTKRSIEHEARRARCRAGGGAAEVASEPPPRGAREIADDGFSSVDSDEPIEEMRRASSSADDADAEASRTDEDDPTDPDRRASRPRRSRRGRRRAQTSSARRRGGRRARGDDARRRRRRGRSRCARRVRAARTKASRSR